MFHSIAISVVDKGNGNLLLTDTANYGDSRSDIYSEYPDYANANAGFDYSLDTTKLTSTEGSYTLSIQVTEQYTDAYGNVTYYTDAPITHDFYVYQNPYEG